MFLDTLEYGDCLETGETTKSQEIMSFSRDFVVFLFLDTFEYGRCLETGKQQTIPNIETAPPPQRRKNNSHLILLSHDVAAVL